MAGRSSMWDLLVLVFFAGLCLGAGFVGSFFTAEAIPSWYVSLEKPEYNPPDWVFAPVWTALYLLMAVSAFLVWRTGFTRSEVMGALAIFAAQLVLNVVWSILFFGLRNIFYALLEIGVLWAAILFTIISFYRVSWKAALLLLPYLLWVSFATYLNYSIWLLNS